MSKVIVITGAGEGLGRQLARRFAGEGEQVVLLGRTASKVEAVAAELGDRALAMACDVASPDSVRAAFAAISARHPRIDALINNAAVYQPTLVVEASDQVIRDAIDINLTGAVYCCRTALPLMARGGHIINVTSDSVEAPFALLSLYAAAKAGLERFSTALQDEIKETGIRVSIVRAAAMWDEAAPAKWHPELAQRFYQANLKDGLDLAKEPRSSFEGVTNVFRALLDLPPDVHVMKAEIRPRFP